jgi:hypothetical protein
VGGGPPITLATPNETSGIALDGTNVFFLDRTWGVVTRVRIAGGASTTIATNDPLGTPELIAVDATSVYWTDSTLNTVIKTSKQ